MPSTEVEWKDIANNTFQRWHLPNCFAAAHGKHVQLNYINYKWFFIIALLGLVDYDYRFYLLM